MNADGSSDFKGFMQINQGDGPVLDVYRATTSAGGGVFRLYSDVGATKRRSFAITADGTTHIGGVDNSGNPNITLNADGDIFNAVDNRTAITSECATTTYGQTIKGPVKTIGVNGLNVQGWSYHFRETGTANLGKYTVASDGSTYIGTHRLDLQNPGAPVTLRADGSAHFAGNVTSDGTIGFSAPADTAIPSLAGKQIDLAKTIELMAAKLAELGGVDVASLFVAEDPEPVTQPADPADDEGAST